MQIEDLIYIAIILFLLYKIYKTASEQFSQECSQKAIDDGYISYIFGTPPFVR